MTDSKNVSDLGLHPGPRSSHDSVDPRPPHCKFLSTPRFGSPIHFYYFEVVKVDLELYIRDDDDLKCRPKQFLHSRIT